MTSQKNKPLIDTFWDQRYKNNGVLWGEQPSPTAEIAARYFAPKSEVLEIGFGYCRDLVYLAKNGFIISGIDSSSEGAQMAKQYLRQAGVQAKAIITAKFECAELSDLRFDAVLSHRCLHLLITPADLNGFLQNLFNITNPGAVICIGTRDTRDLDSSQMNSQGDGIYEYKNRPGHLISYWDEKRFQHVFGAYFNILSFVQVMEQESKENNNPCCLTVMVATKN